jgi:hypothetical protein
MNLLKGFLLLKGGIRFYVNEYRNLAASKERKNLRLFAGSDTFHIFHIAT